MKATPRPNNQKPAAMKMCLALLLGASLTASTAQAQILFSQNFDGMTPGDVPVAGTDFTVATPALATATNFSTVVPFGGGNGLQMYDFANGQNVRVEQDFAISSAVHLSLSFARNQDVTPANATSGLFVSLGFAGLSQPNLANRTMAIKLFNDGTFGFERGTQGPGGVFVANVTTVTGTYESPAAGPFGTHTLDIFAYAGTTGGSGISYTGPDAATHSLFAKSYSVFLDGVLVTSVPDSLASGIYGFTSNTATPYSDPGDMGRFGLVTGGASSRVGMDFTIDNIVVSAIPVPEPTSVALLLGGGMLLAWRSRRQVIVR